MKVRATQSVVASIGGSSVRLEVGKVYDIPDEQDADNLIRGKYAEKLSDGEVGKAATNAKK